MEPTTDRVDADRLTAESLDEMLTDLRPRMAAEKQRYMKRRFGVVLAAPLLLVGLVTWASSNDEPVVSQIADSGGELEQPVDLPFVDVDEDKADKANGDAAEKPVTKEDAAKVETGKDADDEVATKTDDGKDVTEELVVVEPTEDEVEYQVVSLGFAGEVDVAVDELALSLGEMRLNDGWTATEIEGKERYAVLLLEFEDTQVLVTLKIKKKTGEMKVSFDDMQPDPTPKPETKADHKKTPPASGSGSTSASTPGGSVFISRSGDALSISISSTAAGAESWIAWSGPSKVGAQFLLDGQLYTVYAVIESGQISVKQLQQDYYGK